MRTRSRRVKFFAAASVATLLIWSITVGHRIFDVEPIAFDIPSSTSQSFEPLFASDVASSALDEALIDVSYTVAPAVPPQVTLPHCAGPRDRHDAFVPGSRDTYAFLPITPSWSYTSLEEHCRQIDVLVPAWYEFSGQGHPVFDVALLFDNQARIGQLIKANRNSFALLPTVSLPSEDRAQDLETLLGTSELRQSVADELLHLAVSNDFDGICLDTSGFPTEAIGLVTDLAQRVRAAFENAHLVTCTVMSFDSEFWMNADLVTASDRAVVTMVREPFPGSFPAPVAPQQWFVESADFVASVVPSEKLVFALGTGGYDWTSQQIEPVWTDFTSIVSQTAQNGGQVQFFDIDLNSQATLTDSQQHRHVSWFLDAASFHNQLRALERYGLAGVAVWTMGREDPGVWDVLALQGAGFAELADRLGTVSVADGLRYFGEGPFFRLSSEAVTGRRRFTDDPETGLIQTQTYAVLPQPVLLERFGKSAGNQIALTFDDGPDPVYTEQILDILKEKGVKATFFVVGQNVALAPDVLRRIVREGHIVGSHSFFHPHLEQLSPNRIKLELNSVQRMVAGLTGHRMILYRTPFGNSEGPDTAEIAQPVRVATSLGYVEMGSDVVAYDWTHISAAEIAAHVRQGAHEGSTVIMLHDGGGDRHATVGALGLIIDQLQAEGFTFVTASELLGLEYADLMPVDNSFETKLDGVSFNILVLAAAAFVAIFWITVILGILRSALLLLLALIRRPVGPAHPICTLPVTVIIAAYNEAAVIVDSVRTILASDYDDLRVLVIDDGSTDGTAKVIRSAFHSDPRVKVHRQENGGKWRALNTAYTYVTTDLVVAIDADTVLRKDALRKLLAPFGDPMVGAVAGNVKVGNRLNLLTRLEALEYITAQNLERRVFSKINGMLVVPGAIGAWRVAAVRAAGGYSGDTLAEDADLTVSIQRKGYKVRFVEDAISITEAPATIAAFLKQRLRWTLGMMQMGWKHRGCIAERRTIGLVSLIDLQVFGVLFALFAPIADLVLIKTVGVAIREYLAGRPALDPAASSVLLAGYILLPLMDVLLAAVAVGLDRRNDRSESYLQLWVLPFQRIFYRQLLYFTVYRAVLRALTGRLAKWGSLERMGTVKLAQWT